MLICEAILASMGVATTKWVPWAEYWPALQPLLFRKVDTKVEGDKEIWDTNQLLHYIYPITNL